MISYANALADLLALLADEPRNKDVRFGESTNASFVLLLAPLTGAPLDDTAAVVAVVLEADGGTTTVLLDVVDVLAASLSAS